MESDGAGRAGRAALRVAVGDAALAEADAADARRGDGAPLLNGVPIAIKDDTDVAGEATARGLFAHGGLCGGRDA